MQKGVRAVSAVAVLATTMLAAGPIGSDFAAASPLATKTSKAMVPTVVAHMGKSTIRLSTGHRIHAGRVIFKVVARTGGHTLQLLRLHEGYTWRQAQQDFDAAFRGDLDAIRRVDHKISLLGGSSARSGIGDRLRCAVPLRHVVVEDFAKFRHDATDPEIEDAARRANAHEFIVRLPEQYETFIGERGVKLSGGQQQRLAIARAVLKSPQILILDEATSNLDTESEQLIQASMAALLAGRTTFVIAHRLSTVRRADLILLMEEGRVLERGTHAELMQERGLYYGMVLRQMESTAQDGEQVLR